MEICDFFYSQLAAWPDVRARYEALKNVMTRELGGMITAQHNPARIRSTGAKTDAASIAARPCFLCPENRPKEQFSMPICGGEYELLVNPYPILPMHFTIAAKEHRPQRVKGVVQTIRGVLREYPDLTVFYNGPHCGASAPDHAHLQAGAGNLLPIQKHYDELRGGSPFSYLFYELDEGEDVTDDDVNILGWEDKIIVFPRSKHRPDCYGELMVSPGALDMAGLIILPRREDYERITYGQACSILREVSEPHVSVGIMSGKEIESEHNPDGTVTIKGVTIGKQFHWERQEAQTFRGRVRIVEEGGLQTAVNILRVEDYLECVISSEMAATAPVEFLKAHAVIARSWLLSQTREKTGHALYDVCADDHCQRYQGLSRTHGMDMGEIVKATRGEVLMFGGEICDARYSKCCGGTTEEYRYCWDGADKPYLTSVSCPYCNTDDKALLSSVLNDYDLETRNFYSWEVTYTEEELSALVARVADVGTIKALVPLERGKSGRISRLKVVGTRGEYTTGKELAIRRLLSKNHLYSSAFNVERTGNTFTLHGRGWGHGVGLCQIGAAVMGARGFSYREILAHYYPRAEIRKIY